MSINYESARIEPELKAKLDEGRPILLVARNSSNGSGARDYAADELAKAAEVLLYQTGIDVRSFIPSRNAIETAIKTATTQVSRQQDTDKKMRHKWAVLKPTPGLVLLVGNGTGRKLDKDGEQPAVTRIVEAMKEFHPAIVFAHRMDRQARHMLSAGRILHQCQITDAYLGDSDRPVAKVDNLNALLSMFKASSGEAEADKIPTSTRKGMLARTQPIMTDGRVLYACTPAPPPGLARISMRNTLGTRGDTLMILDAPAYYPSRDDVLYGIPSEIVDNVALVQWALANLGKPGMSLTRVGKYLCDRAHSNSSLRRHRGVEATFEGTLPTSRAIRAIMNNLDFYRTGEFTARLGVEGVDDMTITGCAPEGGWASSEDFDRIDAWLAGSASKSRKARMSFVGLRVGDGSLTLRTAPAERAGEEPSYMARPATGTRLAKRLNLPAISHAELAESIVEALVEQSSKTWLPVFDDDSSRSELRIRQSELEAELATLERRIIKRQEEMLARDHNDDLLLPPSAIRAIAAEVEEMEKVTKPGLLAALRELRTSIPKPAVENNAAGLLKMVSSLRDPFDTDWREFWLEHLRLDELSAHGETRKGLAVRVTVWKGTLTLHEKGEVFEVAFSGSSERGAYIDALASLDDIVADIIEGPLTFDEMPLPNTVELRSLLAEHLGFDPRHFAIGSCPDARLQAVGFALAASPDSSDDEVAMRLDVDEQLVAHMRELLARGLMSWLRRPNRLLAHVSCAIAEGQDEFTSEQFSTQDWGFARRAAFASPEFADAFERGHGTASVVPCACGSRVRLASVIWGPRGLVCFECGTDSAGVVWDESYRKYLIGARFLGVDEYDPGSRTKSRAPGTKRTSSKAMRAALADRKGSESSMSA